MVIDSWDWKFLGNIFYILHFHVYIFNIYVSYASDNQFLIGVKYVFPCVNAIVPGCSALLRKDKNHERYMGRVSSAIRVHFDANEMIVAWSVTKWHFDKINKIRTGGKIPALKKKKVDNKLRALPSHFSSLRIFPSLANKIIWTISELILKIR